ncbi:MAG: EAL domain-containing protein [Desulfobacterales bacterium]|nr:EAL domain-containing protein [Desulfobacterales bacterium]
MAIIIGFAGWKTIHFELSEKYDFSNPQDLVRVLKNYRDQGFSIAMDDYGVGFSGLQMLYYTEPEFIKIDRFFIQDIKSDSKKKLFVSSIVDIGHLLGSIVIAEGVETEEEYYICRDLGCDLVQGYLVCYPEKDIDTLKSYYEHIDVLNKIDRRKASKDHKLINEEIGYMEPILEEADVFNLFEKFKKKKANTFFPVINSNNEPVGIIRESSLKDYTYSKYGMEILKNPSFGGKLSKFVTKFPIVDIHTTAEKILEIFSNHEEDIEGIIIVENMKYKGFLSASALLKVLNEKKIAIAKEQNPLTKLPGNMMIFEYLSEAVKDLENQYILIYFDFDNFKPYNDKYGFRSGDRVILLFSDILKNYENSVKCFIGHIGGDDFFMGIKEESYENIHPQIIELMAKFRHNVESFYDSEALKAGYIKSTDREGNEKQFPILTVSAAILELTKNRKEILSIEELTNMMATLKKMAKKSINNIYYLNTINLDNSDF